MILFYILLLDKNTYLEKLSLNINIFLLILFMEFTIANNLLLFKPQLLILIFSSRQCKILIFFDKSYILISFSVILFKFMLT